MNGKQNLIFFIGLILIVMVFWVNGYWSILKSGLFYGVGNSAPPVGPANPTKPSSGKCPPGYVKVGTLCFPQIASGNPGIM